MLRMFTGRDLMRIGKRVERVAGERAQERKEPPTDDRARALERESRQLREWLRRHRSG